MKKITHEDTERQHLILGQADETMENIMDYLREMNDYEMFDFLPTRIRLASGAHTTKMEIFEIVRNKIKEMK